MNREQQEQQDVTPDLNPAQEPVETPGEDQLQQLAADLQEARRQSDEYLTLAQRVQADFDNYRKRNNAARAEAFDEGAVALAKTLLPVVDNLERAVDATASTTDTALREGVLLVQRQLMETLEKRGIVAICRLGEKFDPELENAVMTAPPEEGEPGTVCQVLQKGYQMDKYVLRHAMVMVVAE